ncbi:MAG: hypothetical protein JRD43_00150 [Deltaproteobacteria bacterium]|nr:hypothetical protein [Deltaproteobacteria bacterium]MBW2594662.1 hypothetical protein [Deltaproteobacteria bacterium]
MRSSFYYALPAILLFFVFYPLCAYSSPDTIGIETEGTCLVSGGGRAPARDSAIDDSMRKAVERIVCMFISEDVVEENFDAINDNIYSKSQDYIQDYRILREGVENDLYNVRVRVSLSVGDIKDDLEMLGVLTDEWHPEEGATAVIVKVVVSGIEKYSHFRMLRETLETDMKWVDTVHLRRMESGVAVMDVDMQGNAAGLANELALKEFKGFSLSITDINPGVIELNMVKE